MVDRPLASDAPRSRRIHIWTHALLAVGFIATLVLTAEAAVFWALASLAHAPVAALALAAIVGLLTLAWLVGVCLPVAVRAERAYGSDRTDEA